MLSSDGVPVIFPVIHSSSREAGEASDTTPGRLPARSSSALGHAAHNFLKGGAARDEAVVGTASSLGLGELYLHEPSRLLNEF